jgi:hypothetical protein
MGGEYYLYNDIEVSKDYELVILTYMSNRIYYTKITIEELVTIKSGQALGTRDLIDASNTSHLHVWDIHVIRPCKDLSDTIKRLMTLTKHDGFADHYADFCNTLDDLTKVFELIDEFITNRNLAIMNIKNESPFLAKQAKKAL